MRTSLIEVQEIENYLLKTGEPGDRLVTEVRLQLNESIQTKAHFQAEAYSLIHHYGREQLRAEIKQVENQLFTHRKFRSFQERIKSIFKP